MIETKHSPEPWWFEEEGGAYPGGAVVGDAENTDGMFEASNADARRIVAAVNAVAGIPTEALEAGRLDEALSLWADAISVEADLCVFPEINDAAAALRALGRLPP